MCVGVTFFVPPVSDLHELESAPGRVADGLDYPLDLLNHVVPELWVPLDPAVDRVCALASLLRGRMAVCEG